MSKTLGRWHLSPNLIIRITERLVKETSGFPEIPESECPEGAGAPLFLTSTLDDSDDEPGMRNTGLCQKAVS